MLQAMFNKADDAAIPGVGIEAAYIYQEGQKVAIAILKGFDWTPDGHLRFTPSVLEAIENQPS